MVTDDLLIIMLVLKLRGRIGRYHLANMLGLGEGVIKDRLRALKEMKLIQTSRSGSMLTSEGLRRLQELLSGYGLINVEEVDLSQVFNRKYNYCVIGGLTKWASGIDIVELRDIGIKSGGDAVLIMRNDCQSIDIPLTGLTVEKFSVKLADELRLKYPCGSHIIAVCGSNMYGPLKGLIEIAKIIQAGHGN